MAGVFCSIEEAEFKYGITSSQIHQLWNDEIIKEFKDGKTSLLKVSEIEEYILKVKTGEKILPFVEEIDRFEEINRFEIMDFDVE